MLRGTAQQYQNIQNSENVRNVLMLTDIVRPQPLENMYLSQEVEWCPVDLSQNLWQGEVVQMMNNVQACKQLECYRI